MAKYKEEKAKITGGASTTPSRGENAKLRQLPSQANLGNMARSIPGPRSRFDDQKKVNTLYRWRGGFEKI